MSQNSEIKLPERHLAGEKVLKRMSILQMSDDQLEMLTRADCITMHHAAEIAGLNAISRAWQAGVTQDERREWGITAEMLFWRRLDQGWGSVRYAYEDVTARVEEDG
jgi:hypothetical protein